MKQGNFQSVKSTNVRLEKLLIAAYGAAINAVGTLAPSLALRLAVRLYLSTRRNPRRKKDPLLKSAKVFEVPQENNRIRLYSWGSGPTVLLVHGWNGWGTQLSGLIPPLLERGYRVVTFDAVGHGESQGRRSTIFKFADGIALAEKVAGPFYAIISHSLGGAGATLALKEGVRAERAVFLAPPLNPRYYVKRFIKLLGIKRSLGERIKKHFDENYGARWELLHDPRLIEAMTTPLLVIHDRDDSQVSWEEGRHLATAWPGAQFHRTEGLGHNRLLKDAEVIRRAVEFVHRPTAGIDSKNEKGESHENHRIPLGDKLHQPVYA